MKPLVLPKFGEDELLLIKYDNLDQYNALRLFLHKHGWAWRDNTPLNRLDKVPYTQDRDILVVTKTRKIRPDYNGTVSRSKTGSDLVDAYREHLCTYKDLAIHHPDLVGIPNHEEAFFISLDTLETKLKNHASNKWFTRSFW